MKIAICEDDELAAGKLAETIHDWAETRKVIVEINSYNNAESFLMDWPDVTYDLAFLDIQMKNITGIQLAGIIREKDKSMMLVFLTGHKQYALKGYDVNALHYLIKPLSTTKLISVLNKALLIWNTGHKEFLLVSNDMGTHRIIMNDIIYFSMQAHNAEMHLIDTKHIMRITANKLIESLPSSFIRCHRSYIVNMHKVDCIYKDTLRLCNGEQLPISRSRAKNIKDTFVKMHMR